MGKKISQTTKEILQIVIFLVVVAVLLTAFVCYPLNRTKAIMGRVDVDDFNPDSLPANDPTAFVEAGLPFDTFHVDPDALTRLACVYIPPLLDSGETARGTVVLLHDERDTREAMIPLATVLHDSGFGIITYDQRASGFSGAKYHGEGRSEADDLVEMIAYLDIRDRAVHPVTIVGQALGADAALMAAHDEQRIDRVVAIKPYLTTSRMITMLKDEHDCYWLPFFNTVFWWWYEIRSGYASPYREVEQIQAVAKPSLIFDTDGAFESEEYVRLTDLSDAALLQKQTLPTDANTLAQAIVRFAGE
ncbi:MAG: alpha/beta hydrolase [Candidatus Zixiibacteriota bacterium]|nr:MAG: alpha/beta hydrolase [candidate division Zixibacteria bacterium]